MIRSACAEWIGLFLSEGATFAKSAGLRHSKCRRSVTASPDLIVNHRIMRISRPSRRISTLTAMGVLLLACAVFGWGLEYKMSLYAPMSTQTTSIPEAKLLSEKERPASDRSATSIRSVSTKLQASIQFSLFLITLLAMELHLKAALWMRITRVPDDLRQQRCAHSNYFSFRPPPVLFPSH